MSIFAVVVMSVCCFGSDLGVHFYAKFGGVEAVHCSFLFMNRTRFFHFWE
jgi:hypothetical protein